MCSGWIMRAVGNIYGLLSIKIQASKSKHVNYILEHMYHFCEQK